MNSILYAIFINLLTSYFFIAISVRTIISAIVDAILDGDKKKRSEIPGIKQC